MAQFLNYTDMYRVAKRQEYYGVYIKCMLHDISILEDIQKESILIYIKVHYKEKSDVDALCSIINEADRGLDFLYTFEDKVVKKFTHIYEETIIKQSWRRYCYAVLNWEKYNLCDTKDDFIRLMNILEAHGENLDTLHECSDIFCGIVFSNIETDRFVVQALFDYNIVYSDYEHFIEIQKEHAKENDCSLEEELASLDIHTTLTGIVNTIYY